MEQPASCSSPARVSEKMLVAAFSVSVNYLNIQPKYYFLCSNLRLPNCGHSFSIHAHCGAEQSCAKSGRHACQHVPATCNFSENDMGQ